MAGSYSRIIPFATASTTEQCIELPAAPRGDIDRIIITQTSGTAMAATFKIYDRRGACVGASDINVTNSGDVSAIANAAGSVQVTFSAAHGMQVGDTFEIKENDVADYNTLHSVVTVVSDTAVISSVAYTGVSAVPGVWQTEPFLPTTSPAGHLLYAGTVVAGTDFTDFGINRGYENRDNQLEVSRLRNSALWLEFKAGSSGAASWEVAFTIEALQLL